MQTPVFASFERKFGHVRYKTLSDNDCFRKPDEMAKTKTSDMRRRTGLAVTSADQSSIARDHSTVIERLLAVGTVAREPLSVWISLLCREFTGKTIKFC